MPQMGSFLAELLGATAGAAAAVAGTAVGGPVAGAAAAVGAKQLTSALVTAFVDAQQEELQSLELMNRALQGRLARIEAGLFSISGDVHRLHADVKIQLEEPWLTALTYLDHAATSGLQKSTRQEYLRRARDKLFEAHSMARDDAKRGLIAQNLAGIAVMLNDFPSARKWLLSAYPSAARLVESAAHEAQDLFNIEWDMHRITRIVHRAQRLRRQDAFETSDQQLRFLDTPEEFWARYLAASPAVRTAVAEGRDAIGGRLLVLRRSRQATALRRLVRMKQELDMLRNACLALGNGQSSGLVLYVLHVDIMPLVPTTIKLVGRRFDALAELSKRFRLK